jgi:DNA-binding NtrC family response regulator
MLEALSATQGARAQAAELIGMPLRTFVTKLKDYAIDVPVRRGDRGPKRHGR